MCISGQGEWFEVSLVPRAHGMGLAVMQCKGDVNRCEHVGMNVLSSDSRKLAYTLILGGLSTTAA